MAENLLDSTRLQLARTLNVLMCSSTLQLSRARAAASIEPSSNRGAGAWAHDMASPWDASPHAGLHHPSLPRLLGTWTGHDACPSFTVSHADLQATPNSASAPAPHLAACRPQVTLEYPYRHTHTRS
ncbi:hypothetical protein PSPO01_03436 [Paraphaeosphaeria sporulosa]